MKGIVRRTATIIAREGDKQSDVEISEKSEQFKVESERGLSSSYKKKKKKLAPTQSSWVCLTFTTQLSQVGRWAAKVILRIQ